MMPTTIRPRDSPWHCPEAAIEGLRAAYEAPIAEFGAPDELTVMVDVA